MSVPFGIANKLVPSRNRSIDVSRIDLSFFRATMREHGDTVLMKKVEQSIKHAPPSNA